jgi:hypothetical protein
LRIGSKGWLHAMPAKLPTRLLHTCSGVLTKARLSRVSSRPGLGLCSARALLG